MADDAGVKHIDMTDAKNRLMVLALTKYLYSGLEAKGYYKVAVSESAGPSSKDLVESGVIPEEEASKITIVDKDELKTELITMIKAIVCHWLGDPVLPIIANQLILQLEHSQNTGEETKDITALLAALKVDSTISNKKSELGTKKLWLRKTA